MLLLVFYVKKDCYAIDSTNVKEIVPLLSLRSIAKAPDFVAGLFNYHGISVPVIDLCLFLKNKKSKQYYNSRIIVVNYSSDYGKGLLGLIAENVTDVTPQDTNKFKPPCVKLATPPFFGETVRNKYGMIQIIELQKLITSELVNLLFPKQCIK